MWYEPSSSFDLARQQPNPHSGSVPENMKDETQSDSCLQFSHGEARLTKFPKFQGRMMILLSYLSQTPR